MQTTATRTATRRSRTRAGHIDGRPQQGHASSLFPSFR